MGNSCRQKTVDVSCRHFRNLSQVDVTITSSFEMVVAPAQEKNQTGNRFFSVVGIYLVSSLDCLKCSCSKNIHYITESGIYAEKFPPITTLTKSLGHGKRIPSHKP